MKKKIHINDEAIAGKDVARKVMKLLDREKPDMYLSATWKVGAAPCSNEFLIHLPTIGAHVRVVGGLMNMRVASAWIEYDDGVYLLAASMSGGAAGSGNVHFMKRNVIRKAREHCAQQNKVMKVVSKEGQGGSSSSSFGALAGGGLMGMGGGSSAAGAHFDIVFTCRERMAPATLKTPAAS